MPTEGLLLDTGPLVAYLDSDDRNHAWACSLFEESSGPLITCEPVLAEAFFLLRRHVPQINALEEMLWDGRFNLSFSLASEARAIVHLRRSYRNVPMSLADACLVRLSELHPKLSLITFDSDFHIYRRNKRQLIPIIAPPIV